MAKAKAPKTYPCHCNQCGYDWQSKKKRPLHCASCISDKWDKPLVGKRLRKAVPSRARLAKGRKGRAVSKASAPKKARAKKATEAKVKAPRAPRVKKEKGGQDATAE